jgi:splicing factor 3A subunit 1
MEADQEKVAFATIDWHDFIVVETIEFLEADARTVLPQPMNVLELQSMTLEQRKSMINFEAAAVALEEDEQDMEMDQDDMEMSDGIVIHLSKCRG